MRHATEAPEAPGVIDREAIVESLKADLAQAGAFDLARADKLRRTLARLGAPPEAAGAPQSGPRGGRGGAA